jgi:glycosyltransferase involved in cell wall biosynthesis
MFVVNVDWFFLSHRLPLAQAARDAGATVYVVGADTGVSVQIEKEGFTFIPLPISRTSVSVTAEAKTVLRLCQIYRRIRPDIVHHVTIKPILYGSLAARIVRNIAVVNAVSGLGSVFGEVKQRHGTRSAIDLLYHLALSSPRSRTIFQTVSDRDHFVTNEWIRYEDTVLIRGSGVDTEEFQAHPEPTGVPLVLFASRLLREKGVEDLVTVARMFAEAGDRSRFVLVGRIDPDNPSAVARNEVDGWVQEGIIEWWGNRDDMPAVYAQANLVVLPTYYKEGVPKALIEAAACGRAIVTTDIPGCRDIVRDRFNGLLITPRRPEDLADAIRTLLSSPALRFEFGANGRRLATEEFDIRTVVAQTLDAYRSLLETVPPVRGPRPRLVSSPPIQEVSSS